MYCISEQQIEFILNDIKQNGVELEDLQLNLLDHVCCIIEHELEENGDFEQFYHSAIKSFYKRNLVEIEEETISLINNKNYYAMKKVMIMSGIISATLFSCGIAFKFMQWAGASLGIVLGIGIFCLVFLPLVFTLKAKEKQQNKDKVLMALGALSAISMSFSILFRIMHWPGAVNLGYLTIAILVLVYLPISLTFGLRNSDTKVNTIVNSVLLVTGCCLWLTLVVSPKGSRLQSIRNTQMVMRNLQLLQQEQKQVQALAKASGASNPLIQQSEKINEVCNDLVAFLVEQNTGTKINDAAFENKEMFIEDAYIDGYWNDNPDAENKLNELRKMSVEYNVMSNSISTTRLFSIPLTENVLDNTQSKVSDRLLQTCTDFFQIQMFVLQNERALLSAK